MGKIVPYKIKPLVLGTGLIALDLVVSADPKKPIYHWAGGTCGNVLTILSYLGWKSFPVARLNGDSASLRVKADMSRWDVKLAFAEQTPTASTPIITQQISRDEHGNSTHKFKWTCPKCGAWLPFYKAVTIIPAKITAEKIKRAHVFFFDRVSPSALILAKKCKELGAVIFFEPSAKGDPKNFSEALKLAHIIKYSKESLGAFVYKFKSTKPALLEIQTIGQQGLMFRSNLPNAKSSKWVKLPAMKVEKVKDSCGCGDWVSAGLISKLCANEGLNGFTKKTLPDILSALNFGQALAAWNCGFEGARGGMYQVDKKIFNSEIPEIIKHGIKKAKTYTTRLGEEAPKNTICPACSNK